MQKHIFDVKSHVQSIVPFFVHASVIQVAPTIMKYSSFSSSVIQVALTIIRISKEIPFFDV